MILKEDDIIYKILTSLILAIAICGCEVKAEDSFSSVSAPNYYYNQLDEADKILYDKLLIGFQNYETTIEISGSEEKIDNLLKVITTYEPTIFHIKTFFISEFDLSPEYTMTKQEYDEVMLQINKKADEIFENIPKNATEYEKEKYIYDYMVRNYSYKKGEAGLAKILGNETNCNANAKIFQFLCSKAGIECSYVTGTYRNEAHAWNIIRIDNQYYNVDVTGAVNQYIFTKKNIESPEVPVNFFNLSDDWLERSYVRDESLVKGPQCIESLNEKIILDKDILRHELMYFFNVKTKKEFQAVLSPELIKHFIDNYKTLTVGSVTFQVNETTICIVKIVAQNNHKIAV